MLTLIIRMDYPFAQEIGKEHFVVLLVVNEKRFLEGMANTGEDFCCLLFGLFTEFIGRLHVRSSRVEIGALAKVILVTDGGAPAIKRIVAVFDLFGIHVAARDL